MTGEESCEAAFPKFADEITFLKSAYPTETNVAMWYAYPVSY